MSPVRVNALVGLFWAVVALVAVRQGEDLLASVVVVSACIHALVALKQMEIEGAS